MMNYRAVLLCLILSVGVLMGGCAAPPPSPTATPTPTPTNTPTPVPPTPTATATPELLSLLDMANEAGNFTGLLLAAQALGLTETLAGDGPFTIFAPSDEAFNATLTELGLSPTDLLLSPDLMRAIVEYHIVDVEIPAENLVMLGTLPTLSGEEITVSSEGGVIVLNGNVAIMQEDLFASNGVMHVIDRVLIPPSALAALGLNLPFTAEVLDTFETGGEVGAGAAEIVAFDVEAEILFLLRGDIGAIEVIDASDPANLTSIAITELGGQPNSVAWKNGVIAIAVEGEDTDSPGSVVILDGDWQEDFRFETGVLPDMVTFSPDGKKIITANEGEPSDDYSVDPAGSVTVIDIGDGLDEAVVTTLDFEEFSAGGARADELSVWVRVFGLNATFAQDVEPEYVAVSPDSTTAYVTLQENNAIAVIDLAALEITEIIPLGFKDHSVEGNGFDAIEDGEIDIATWPVMGMYLPDAIDAFEVDGEVYLITANEGDSRDYEGYSEETTVGEVELDAETFDERALQPINDLEITSAQGDTDDDGDFDVLFTYGGRSFTIWTTDGEVVFDSGDWLERIGAEIGAEWFNSNGDPESFDSRSPAKGPEPEAVTVGEIGDRLYAFVGLERFGGVMIFDISDPTAPEYVTYLSAPTDISPEGVLFIEAADSPTGDPLLVVANEVSGTMTVYELALRE